MKVVRPYTDPHGKRSESYMEGDPHVVGSLRPSLGLGMTCRASCLALADAIKEFFDVPDVRFPGHEQRGCLVVRIDGDVTSSVGGGHACVTCDEWIIPRKLGRQRPSDDRGANIATALEEGDIRGSTMFAPEDRHMHAIRFNLMSKGS